MTEEETQRLIVTPAGFIYLVLLQGRKELASWQADFVNKFRDPRVITRASLVTPNGSGKSSVIIAGLGLWLISIFPRGKYVICSFDSKQLDHQCWPAIEMHRSKFENEKGWRFIEREVHTPDGGFIVGFTTDDPGRAEGWHKDNDLDGPLVMMFDEAKSIMDGVFDAGNRCTYNAQGYVSSPGLNVGRFYDSQNKLKKVSEEDSGFDAMEVGLVDCPWIPKARIDETIAEYGLDHPFTQSTLFGKFIDQDADTMFVVPKRAMKDAMEAKPAYVHGGRAAFVDFAAGRNENVITVKEGNRYEQICWKDTNVMASIGRCLVEFRKRGLHPSETYGDAGGMGVAIISRFHEVGWPIIAVKNDDPPINPMYENLGAESWHEGSKKIQAQTEIIPNDPILYEQGTTRKIKFTSDGLLGLESKKDMDKRGLSSPDRFDSLVGAMRVDTALRSALFDEVGLRRLEAQARMVVPECGSLSLVGNDTVWELNAQNSFLDVWERPIVGRNYVCVLNPVWHDDPFGHHVLIMIRRGWKDEKGKDQPARLVAKLKKPCRMDATPLVKTIKLLCNWYGGAFVIPIANERGDIIDTLLNEGVGIYSRNDFEHIHHGREINRAVTFGWESNEYNRSLWIGALAETVRAGGIECADLETVMQMFSVTAQNAKAYPDAEALGVGMKEILFATRFNPPPKTVAEPVKRRQLAKAMYS